MAKAVWITVKDGEGNDIKVPLDEVLDQVTARDIISNFDTDDLLNEIGVGDAIRCFGEDTVFTYLDSFEVVPSHVSAIDIVSMYDKDNKVIKPVTITTYNMLAYKTKGEFLHFKKFASYNWGLVIMDEVHLMPADFFRIVTSLQSCKRLALTATFIREDGREKDIFSLVGPRRYNVSWKDLESKGYIAKVGLTEVRVPLNNIDKERYVNAKSAQEKFEIASTASSKLNVIKQLLEKHKNDKVLIIGMFTGHLLELAKDLNIPCVYGESSNKEREKYYDMMREDKINVLIASKIASTALDIPKINVVIQVSIQYGSRSAEAQIVGRATRPKESDAFFYTIVSKDTNEEDYNFNRKQFLMDEGYRYEVTEIAA